MHLNQGDGGDRYDFEEKINFAVFPAMQGGPHNNHIAALAIALKQVATPEYKAYMQQVKKNAQALASALLRRNCRIITGGTDNHMLIWDLRNFGVTGMYSTYYFPFTDFLMLSCWFVCWIRCCGICILLFSWCILFQFVRLRSLFFSHVIDEISIYKTMRKVFCVYLGPLNYFEVLLPDQHINEKFLVVHFIAKLIQKEYIQVYSC